MPRLALIQMSMSPDTGVNLQKGVAAFAAAAAQDADIVLFPELQLSPFFPQYPDFDAARYRLTLDGTEVLALRRACARFNVIGALNVYLLAQTGSFDASILVDTDGEVVGVSKMVHITQAPCFYEQSYYAPSDEGFRVYETAVGKVGIVICFDRHFPESIRCCALQGADMILIPTANLQGEPLEMFEWELRVAAFHNSVYIAMCNRVGQEDAVRFCGRSVVVNPDGQVIARAGEGEQILTADLDLGFVRGKRRQNKYLELRRADAFRVTQS